MERSLTLARLYTLGNYRNAKVEYSITGIPVELSFNSDLIAKMQRLQFIEADLAYIDYIKTSPVVNRELNTAKDIEEAETILLDNRTDTFEALKVAFASSGENSTVEGDK